MPTFKCFLYLKKVDSFPFEFIEGSHKFSFKNGIWHTKCQIKNYLENIKKNKNIIDKFLSFCGMNLTGGSWRYYYTKFRPSEPDFITKNTRTFNVNKNTLVIANTCGLHRKSPNKALDKEISRKLFFVGERSLIFL